MNTSRRQFLMTCCLAGPGVGFGAWTSLAAPAERNKVYRAAIIGRTGGGDYGHGYDQVFNGLDNVRVVAVADHDLAGLQRAVARSGAQRQYFDYREMLAKEKPELVAIAPRQPDCHAEMALAASVVADGIFIEKPFTESVDQADAILAAAEKRGVKIIVAHNRRYTAEFMQVKALLDQGFIGQIREGRIQGKQDSRVGGEDMLVLGTHDFDLMRWYFGDPRWCFASVTTGGRESRREDIHPGHEPFLVAGDTIHALFGFPDNLVVSWDSVKRTDQWNTNFSKREKWGFEIYGTRGIMAYQSGFGFAWLNSPFLAQRSDEAKWQPLPAPEQWKVPDYLRHPIKNLIHAIETSSQPICSGYDGRWAVAMVAAVYQSQWRKARVSFPLTDRANPLRTALAGSSPGSPATIR